MSEGLTSYETEFRLHHKEGHYVPVLSRGFILRDDAGKAIRVSGTNTDLTERKRTEKQIHKLAFYDALTGLPNRQMLMELLRSAMDASKRSHQHGALVFIDLDNFKMLNDTRGHDIGDLLLQQVARRLRRCMRGADAVARLGGDEFVIVLENLGVNFKEATRKAEEAAQKIREAMSIPFVLGSTDYRCTVSIGVAPFEDFNHGVDGVFKQADLAMYKAKAAGRNAVRFFDSAMQVAVDEQLALENDLRTGLQAKQLVIYMQPQVNQTGTILGAEVLVRWRHPTRGMVLPAVFIALAEATGLILPLGEWVLRATCRQLALWASHPQLSTLTLSVNVSVRQFHEVDFVDKVLKTLGETGANPAKLKMEMTESLLAENLKDIVAKMSRLRSYGIRLSLDDFGTGYSSLSYLQRMPLNELKIDRAFVRDVLTNPNDAAIARIIISLAANLGLDVIAEGVETEGQRQFLESHGCLNYQGYLFGKPMALADFEASVAALDISSLVSKV